MNRAVIIGNADINNYEKIKTYLKNDDYYVFCDGALKHKDKLGIVPDLIVGDFDSFDENKIESNCEIVKLPVEKDDTDTFAAVKRLVNDGVTDFVLLGVIGNRLDHTFGNLSILTFLFEKNLKSIIVDDYSEMFICKKECIIQKNSCKYFSVLALSEEISGVDIIGAKYPLNNAIIRQGWQYGISNECVDDSEISVSNGVALIIKVF